MTATPEPLLVGEGEEWHTVALAGTQPNGDSSSVLWDDKNREEQALVARFITDKLTPLTKDLNVSETRTVEAGNVCHLCTDFSFRLSGEDDIKAILTALHPTPAVCGHPRQEALKAILEDEISPRRYYAGFSGPLALHGTTRLYVSLRCMYRDEEEAVLYAGGGIMPESRMEAEWQETERKLQTMLGLL